MLVRMNDYTAVQHRPRKVKVNADYAYHMGFFCIDARIDIKIQNEIESDENNKRSRCCYKSQHNHAGVKQKTKPKYIWHTRVSNAESRAGTSIYPFNSIFDA